MKRTLPEVVVDFLSFSGTTSNCLDELGRFHRRQWEHTFTWLHDAGVALYLLQKLKDTNATEILPKPTLCRLEENLIANRQRVAYMARQFDSLNHEFNRAGVRYAVVKGFSLVPLFCPDASLRHQSDFDYLIDNQSVPAAQRVLKDAGYCGKKYTTNEYVFLMPSAQIPPPASEQYDAHAPHAVELRLAFWDSDSHGVPMTEPQFSLDNMRTQCWQGLTFRALPEEDAFLLQVIHALNHIFGGWVRMSWLYEIGNFLNQRSTDTLLWERIERRVGPDRRLREMMAVITELTAHLFRAPLPPTCRGWAGELRPAVRIWLQNYGRPWVFAKNRIDQFALFSATKLVLFLHQQYLPDPNVRRQVVRTRLLPSRHLVRRTRLLTTHSPAHSPAHRPQLKPILVRVPFHVTAGLRYLWEIPRWKRLNKVTEPLASSTAPASTATDLVDTQRPESTLQL